MVDNVRMHPENSEPETFVVAINPNSGSGHGDGISARLRKMLESRGHHVILRELDLERDIAGQCLTAADEAGRCGATLVACGGDGTLNAVAAAALEADVPLGILPQGTFNYFGRAHGIPADIDEGVAILLASRVRPVQVGIVNGKVFLVNASIGMYPELLEDREAWKRRLGRHRFVAVGAAIATVMRDHRMWRIDVDDGNGTSHFTTPTLLVGNNPLQFARLGLVESANIGVGELLALRLRPIGKWALLAMGLRGALGRLGEDDDVETDLFRRLTVTFRGRRADAPVKVAIDGEIVHLRPPLEFAISSRPLRLRAPHRASAGDDPG